LRRSKRTEGLKTTCFVVVVVVVVVVLCGTTKPPAVVVVLCGTTKPPAHFRKRSLRLGSEQTFTAQWQWGKSQKAGGKN